MSMRVNARLRDELGRKLRRVQSQTQKTTTAIVVESIERYCDALLKDDRAPARRLEGFIGCAEGPSDLSSNYKDVLAHSLGRKT